MAKSQLQKIEQIFSKLAKQKDIGSISIELKASSLPDLSLLENFPSQFDRAAKEIHSRALVFLSEELELALGIAMESNVWGWEYGDGDIYDTGALRDSGRVVVSGNSLQIFYGEEYAAIVHYGGYISPYGNPNVTIYMPGRPWIQAVILGGGPVPQFDMEGTYARYAIPLIKERMESFGYTVGG